jgi:hypothetical protein
LWSSVYSQPFYHTGLINSFEFWIDNDFEGRKTTSLNPTEEFILDKEIDISSLESGYHVVNLRFQDAVGNWSHVYHTHIVHCGPVKTLEYWYDDDFKGRKSVTLSQAMEINVDRLIDGPAILGGFHDLYVRYADEDGSWSSVYHQKFLFAPKDNHVVGAYYWFNDGFDKKKYLAINAKSNPIDVDSLLSLLGENLPQDSLAYLHVQFQDLVGQLSSVFSHRFDNCNTPRLSEVTPKIAGNRGATKLTLKGYCIPQGGSVLLRKQGFNDIIGQPIAMIDARHFSSIFDLDGAPTGVWNVVLRNGNDEIVLKEAFTIEEGRFNVSVDIIGRDIIRTNRAMAYQIAVTNNGNNDLVGLPLIFGISQNVKVTFDNLTFAPALLENDFPLDSFPEILDSFPRWLAIKAEMNDIPIKNGKWTLMFLSAIPVGETKYISIMVNSSANQDFELYAAVANPIFEGITGYGKVSNVQPSKEKVKCLAEIVKAVTKTFGALALPVVNCITDGLHTIFEAGYKYSYIDQTNYTRTDYAWDMASNIIKTTVNCALAFEPTGLRYAYELAWRAADLATDLYSIITDCRAANAPAASQTKKVQSRASYDPNEKTGPEGVGGTNILSGLRPLNYTIHFENKDTLINGKPTLPAQKVVVLDTLDKTKFVMNTFQWGEVRVGKTVLKMTIPSDTLNIEYDMRPAKHILVRINGTLDTVKGIIRCVMESVDPITKREIEDPFDGFLPPNTISPQGEGYVTFSIHPRQDIPQGTPIRNRAAIIFDENKPILTNTYTNRFDYVKPVSQVLSAERVNDTTYKVKWTASDIGVGVRHVTIWASANDGVFERVIINASGTEATFIGGWRKTYRLYSIAQDSVYNTEDRPDQPDFVLTSREESLASAQGIFLYQNFPNPFEETTTIRYSLTKADTIRLEIMDLFGKVVHIPINQQFIKAGDYAVRLSLENLPAGTYFYRLTTSQAQLTKRMIIFK